MTRELIHPVTGQKRVWVDAAQVSGVRSQESGPAIEARPAIRNPQSSIVTYPSLADHSPAFLFEPVTPDRARIILDGALQGDLQSQYDLFSQMEDKWDRLSKDLNEVKNAVKRLTWTVTPYAEQGKEPSPLAQEKAVLVQRALRNWQPEIGTLEYSFEDSLYHALDAMGKGLSVQELHWTMQDGSILPRAAHFLTPRRYGWNRDGSKLGLTAGYQLSTLNSQRTWQPFPADKFLVGQWHARTGFPGGTALLRPLVPYWIGITFGWRWLMQTAQLFGVPFRWATYDTSQPNLVNTISDMLENLGAAGWAAFPAGTTLEFKEAVTSARDNPQALIIELAKKACDLLILGQELSSESEAAGLGSGNALLQGKVRQDVLHGAAYWVADLLNYQLVLPVLRLNFGEPTEAPVIAPDLSIDPDPKLLAERDQILFASSPDFAYPQKDFYERHGVRMPDADEPTLKGNTANLAVPSGNLPDGMTDATEARQALSAKSQDALADKLVNNVLENLTSVQAKWLGGVKPYFRRLIDLARDGDVSDAEFIAALEKAQRDMPELFAKLDTKALQDAFEGALGAACANGAIQGWMKRKDATR